MVSPDRACAMPEITAAAQRAARTLQGLERAPNLLEQVLSLGPCLEHAADRVPLADPLPAALRLPKCEAPQPDARSEPKDAKRCVQDR